jgi:hypothetical protein
MNRVSTFLTVLFEKKVERSKTFIQTKNRYKLQKVKCNNSAEDSTAFAL